MRHTRPSSSAHRADDIDLSRRGFLRAGVVGTALLGTAGIGASLGGCTSSPKPAAKVDGRAVGYRFLSADDHHLLLALAPAILAGALPDDPHERQQALFATLVGIDEGIHHFGPTNRAEFRRLFDLLNFGPTRALTAGVWQSWTGVSPAQADAFLQGWRDSGIGLFNNGYNALVKVTNVAYYGTPANWARSHYPGPPAYAIAALPQFQG